MNDHTGNEHRYYPTVLPKKIRDDGIVPCAAYLIDHILRRRPSYLVGGRRIQITAASKKETREGDKRKRLQDRPSSTQRFGELGLSSFA